MEDQTRILFADDHIPDDEILSQTGCAAIRRILTTRDPRNQYIEGWTYAHYAASEVIRELGQPPQYELITARDHRKATELIKEGVDVAIIDIGWVNDDSLRNISKAEKEGFGFKIAKLAVRNTILIAYSSRFKDQPQLGIDSANAGMLPFFKMDTNLDAEESVRESQSEEIFERRCQAAAKSLRATVDFLVSMRQRTDPKNIALRTYEAALVNLKEANRVASQWTTSALLLAVTSVLLIMVGIIIAYTGQVQIGVISSAGSIIAAGVSSLLFRQSNKLVGRAKATWDEFAKTHEIIIKNLRSEGAIKAGE